MRGGDIKENESCGEETGKLIKQKQEDGRQTSESRASSPEREKKKGE